MLTSTGSAIGGLTSAGIGRVRGTLRAHSAGWLDPGIDIAVGSLVDLIPYGGLVYSAVTGGAKVRKEEREWTTILLTLNESA